MDKNIINTEIVNSIIKKTPNNKLVLNELIDSFEKEVKNEIKFIEFVPSNSEFIFLSLHAISGIAKNVGAIELDNLVLEYKKYPKKLKTKVLLEKTNNFIEEFKKLY